MTTKPQPKGAILPALDALEKLSTGNRLRLMLGKPPLPQEKPDTPFPRK
jgi:hypothetical protein